MTCRVSSGNNDDCERISEVGFCVQSVFGGVCSVLKIEGTGKATRGKDIHSIQRQVSKSHQITISDSFSHLGNSLRSF